MLDSLTKQGRKLKQRLKGKKNKPDKKGAKTAEENINSSGSLLRPVPHIAAGGHSGAGSRTSTDEQAHSGDRSPQPKSVSIGGREQGVFAPGPRCRYRGGQWAKSRSGAGSPLSIQSFDPAAHLGTRKCVNTSISNAISEYSLRKHRHRCS